MFTNQSIRRASAAALGVLLFSLSRPLRPQAVIGGNTHPASAIHNWADEALLTMRVQSSLAGRLDTDALRIRVSVQGRNVTLTGEVEKPASIALAESVARSVEGVESVTNLLTLYGNR